MQHTNPISQLGYIPLVLEQHVLYVHIPVFMCVFLSTCTVDEIQKRTLSLSLSLLLPLKIVFCTSGSLTRPTSTSNKAQR